MIFVGPSLSDISASYVQIESLRYHVRTPLKCLDLCFKAFFALDVVYPIPAQAVWRFIQEYFYELKLKGDEAIPRVTGVISSLEGLHQRNVCV